MFRMRQMRIMLIHPRILLALSVAVPGLVLAQSGSIEVARFALASSGTAVTKPSNHDLPQPIIEYMVKELLDRLSANAEKIKQDSSITYEISNELVVPNLDFPRITRIIIGKYWRDANEEQRERLVDEISAMLMRSYVTAMSAYADDTLTDDQIVYMPSRYQAGDRKATVRSKITLDSGETIDVRYSLYYRDGDWKIYDISFENISLALTYRTSFGNIIKNKGLKDLISQLENRNKNGEIDLPGAVTKKLEEASGKDITGKTENIRSPEAK